jgi:hypothetical protein
MDWVITAYLIRECIFWADFRISKRKNRRIKPVQVGFIFNSEGKD